MNDIKLLVSDIYDLLKNGFVFDEAGLHGNEFDVETYGLRMMESMHRALTPREGGRELGKLWATDLGKPCLRERWYDFHPDSVSRPVEELEGHTKFKFMYGDTVEEKVLLLSLLAGHKVEGMQERVEYKHDDGFVVSGRMDAVIDGVVVDVKSASPFAFAKYKKEGVTANNDTFGYRMQLAFYYWCSDAHMMEQPKFLFVDKSMGHIALVDLDDLPDEGELHSRMKLVHDAVSQDEPPPRIEGHSVPEGKSGNMKLSTACSYCKYKKECFPELRTFIYSKGPVFLTDVVVEPKVMEAA